MMATIEAVPPKIHPIDERSWVVYKTHIVELGVPIDLASKPDSMRVRYCVPTKSGKSLMFLLCDLTDLFPKVTGRALDKVILPSELYRTLGFPEAVGYIEKSTVPCKIFGESPLDAMILVLDRFDSDCREMREWQGIRLNPRS